jgi:hypothetical protein
VVNHADEGSKGKVPMRSVGMETAGESQPLSTGGSAAGVGVATGCSLAALIA